MPDHLTPDDAADRFLAGDDLRGGTEQAMVAAAAVLRQAVSPATDDELANADATVARFVELVRAEPTNAELPRGVRRLPISAKAAAIVAAATLWSTGVAAAATGHLPGGLQRAVSNTAERVGLDVPGPKSDKAESDDQDGANATTTTTSTTSTSTTAGSATTTGSTTTSGSSTTAAATTVAPTPTAALPSGSSVASRGVGPDVAGPAQKGLCNAYLKSLAKGHLKNPDAPPWRNLLAAAEDAGQTVEAFCNGEPASSSTTVASAVTITVAPTTASSTTTPTTTTTTTTTTTSTTTTISADTAPGGGGNASNGNGNGAGGGNSGNGGGNGNGKP